MKPIAEFATSFDKLPEGANATTLKQWAKVAAEVIRVAMQRMAPRLSGQLADDIVVAIASGTTSYQVIAKVGPSKKTAWRAKFIEFGVKPHLISLKHSRVLADKAGDIFGRSAHHPGFSAKPFIRPALDSNSEEAGRVFAQQLHGFIMETFQ